MSSTDDSADAELCVICGPTASGKSALALSLAERVPLAIISADSRQIFRGFDIGTAKPSLAVRSSVPHYGIDIAEPGERYSAAHWAMEAEGWLGEVTASGRRAVIVGGTGLYIRALVRPLFEEPEIDPLRRTALRTFLAHLAPVEVERWCRVLDPERVDLGRSQWERAIEMALLTGYRISSLHGHPRRAAARKARYLVLDPGPELAGMIRGRVDEMLEAGWLDEVRRLVATVPAGKGAWTATGYGAMRDVVTGRRSLDAARDDVIVRTRQYAKRQRTWFRNQLKDECVTRLDPLSPGARDVAERWLLGEEA